MKLHLAQPDGKNLITGYGDGWIQVNQSRHTASFLMTPEHLQIWELSDSLPNADDFRTVLALEPEVFLLGTGIRQNFLPIRNLQLLVEAGIGYEIMSTPAACRTYNILMAEGRSVAIGVLL